MLHIPFFRSAVIKGQTVTVDNKRKNTTQKQKVVSTVYDEDSIQVIKGLEGVRKRPMLYLGARGSEMIWRMLKEVVDNCVDEHLSGRNNYIEVYIDSKRNKFVVKDRAQGIPVGVHKTEKISTLEVIMTRLHAGGKFNDKTYKASAGCFVGDTKVFTLDGKHYTFEQLYKRWKKDESPIHVLSLDTATNKPTVGEIYHVQLSKYVTELAEITLDNGKIIRSTVDHPYFLSNGERIEAQNLKVGQSLNSIHFKGDKDGYLYSKRTGRLNRFVAKSYGEDIECKHVRHKDENILNNSPCNLLSLTPNEENYNKHRQNSDPLFELGKFNLKYHFGTLGKDLITEALDFNYKVVGMKILKVASTPVYGISVKGEHNYLLEAGCFVANTNGIGISATNALSTVLQVWTFRDGQSWHQEYKKGVPQFDVKKLPVAKNILALVADDSKQGTLVYFEPDFTVVSPDDMTVRIDRNKTIAWLRDLALLNTGLTISITCDGKQFKFVNKIGAKALLTMRAKITKSEVQGKPFIYEDAQCTFVFSSSTYATDDGIASYVCNSPTKFGGTHVRGMQNVLFKAIGVHALKNDKYLPKDLLTGLIGVLNWKMSEPEFTSQIKDKLDSNVTKEVEALLAKPIDDFFAKNKKLARDIIKRAALITSSREDYKKVLKSINEVKKASNRALLPTILASAVKANPEQRELYLVEGDSAYGTAKQSRNAAFQEVMKLKGKPINSMREPMAKVLAHEAIQHLIIALGIDTEHTKKGGKHFAAENLRIRNLFLLADADEDGHHINLLMLAFIYKFIPDLIRQERVHVVNAPLFHAFYKNKRYIGSTFDACYKQMPKGSPKQFVIRSKGWGEVDPTTLGILAFDPDTRSYITVDFPRTKALIQRYESIVGDDTAIRKEILNV